MHSLTDAEKQLLILIATLESQNRPTDRQSIEDFGIDYFGMYGVDRSWAYDSLLAKNVLEADGIAYGIATDARPLAERCCSEHPKHRYFYDEFFTRVERSCAHAEFCERVYGLDLAQHGMMDMGQLHRLLDITRMDERSQVLELGCGNGMVAEYISDRTGASVTGMDTSRVGVEQAARRTEAKRSKLRFAQGDMLKVELPSASYDAIVAVDSVYFVRDLVGLLGRLKPLLKPNGQMAFYYSAWVIEDGSRDELRPDGTRLARALSEEGLSYEAIDFTGQEVEHWRRKLRAVEDLRTDFEQEGNEFLYRNRALEARLHQQHVDADRVARYLYHVPRAGANLNALGRRTE